MDAQFWHERWEMNEIGFHQAEINIHLQEFWPLLNLPRAQRVLVPLCGKSRDMLWLLEQGYRVLGVELSALAVAAFFQENQLTFQCYPHGAFTCWEQAEIQILSGDFFSLTTDYTSDIKGVYDRASLVALPPELRIRYVRHLASLVTSGTKIFLVTMEYPQTEMASPPFSVSPSEVEELYKDHFRIQRLITKEVLSENLRFAKRGLTRLTEQVYFMERL